MKKRWICLFVENDVGVLARISGLFSGKSYQLDSLTVGITEDKTVSRMTIGLTGDDQTYEQIKKQLDRCVEVIKVVDYTDIANHMKELMFVRINNCSVQDVEEIFKISGTCQVSVMDDLPEAVLIESVQTENRNNDLIALLENRYADRMEIVRGGSVAIEACSMTKREREK